MGSASKDGVPKARAVALVAKTLHSHDNERVRWRALAAGVAADSGRNSPLGASWCRKNRCATDATPKRPAAQPRTPAKLSSQRRLYCGGRRRHGCRRWSHAGAVAGFRSERRRLPEGHAAGTTCHPALAGVHCPIAAPHQAVIPAKAGIQFFFHCHASILAADYARIACVRAMIVAARRGKFHVCRPTPRPRLQCPICPFALTA
jgi:hypothetical protein